MRINDKIKDALTEQIAEEHGNIHRFRIQKGIEQVSFFWCEKDGNIQDF